MYNLASGHCKVHLSLLADESRQIVRQARLTQLERQLLQPVLCALALQLIVELHADFLVIAVV